MNMLPQLIIDLAYILVLAGAITLLFRYLKQPLVLGYVVAGMIASISISKFTLIGDVENIQTWSDIGVIVLLFSLGLEFSFRKLIKVGGTASVATLFEFVSMFSIGYLIAKLLGWPQMDRIFLGAMLTISSTTIILKAYEDLGLKTRKFAHIVFSILVIEDLIAILELVLLPTFSIDHSFEGSELLFHISKLLFFIILWFLVGIYLIPSILRRVSRIMTDETLLIVALGLCFLMVVVSHSVGFSAALGAFVMGAILGETVESERIAQLIKPVKNLFGAIFFVSVGLMVNPVAAWDHIIPILLISLVVMTIKPISATIGIFISGQTLKSSMQAGFCLCQIGEFSFIIVALGTSLGVISPELYPIAVMVSVITTFFTPYEMKLAEPAYHFAMRKMPLSWRTAIENYSHGVKGAEYTSDIKQLMKKYIFTLILNMTLIIGFMIIGFQVVEPFVDARMSLFWGDLISMSLTLFMCAPFIFALVHNRRKSDAFIRLWNDANFNRGYLISLIFIRYLIALVCLGIIISHYFMVHIGLLVSVVLLLSLIIFSSKRISKRYSHIEDRFLNNWESKKEEKKIFEHDLHMAKLTVSPTINYAGKTLDELKIPQRFGINIASIRRGNKNILIPTKDDVLFPYDELSVIGSDAQLDRFRRVIERELLKVRDMEDVELQSFSITQESSLNGASISNSGIKQKYKILIVGIERESEYIMNPESETTFEVGDIVWCIGMSKDIKALFEKEYNNAK